MFQPQKGAELGSFGNVVLALVCKIKKKRVSYGISLLTKKPLKQACVMCVPSLRLRETTCYTVKLKP